MKKRQPFILTCVGFLFCFVLTLGNQDSSANKAAKASLVKFSMEAELAGKKAPQGKVYALLETEWENIQPKQKVKKSDLEGKTDKTMGVGELREGKSEEKKDDYVDMDVPYRIPNFFDHAYLLADGQTYSLDKLTEAIPGGYPLNKDFTIPKLGDRKKVQFVYLVPARAENIAFQFFDYSNGHIQMPVKGDQKLVASKGAPSLRNLDEVKDSMVEIAAQAVRFQDTYKVKQAREGWRYAVADISGKSLSGNAQIGNIIQVRPEDNIWVTTKEGYLYYSCGGSTTDQGFIRFTPEFSQSQEVAFIVPSSIKEYALGIRLQNRVYTLKLDPKFQPETVEPLATHKDGRTMEIFLYGLRKEANSIVLNLGIRSLVKSGIEIQTSQQFILKTGDGDVYFEEGATQALPHRPPTPFVIPPETFVRFELAYTTGAVPTILYYRGYESEAKLELPGSK